MLDIESSNNMQEKLHITIDKLKKENKFILDNLNDAQNKISDL
mgnify:CR=1 FL=1|jgi:hypothetical protein